MIQYIRVKAELQIYNKELEDYEEVKLSKNKIKELHQNLIMVINEAFLRQKCVDDFAFYFEEQVKTIDLKDVADDRVSDNILNILPIYIGIDNQRQLDENDDIEKPLYCYFKIITKDNLSEEEIEALKNYLAGQISDGWYESPVEVTWYTWGFLGGKQEAYIEISSDIKDMELIDHCYHYIP